MSYLISIASHSVQATVSQATSYPLKTFTFPLAASPQLFGEPSRELRYAVLNVPEPEKGLILTSLHDGPTMSIHPPSRMISRYSNIIHTLFEQVLRSQLAFLD